jgi:histidinol-phosphate aminotransferase
MSGLTRRAFVHSLGLGTAGALSGAVVAFRGREALAGTWSDATQAVSFPGDVNLIRLDSNENPLGPGPAALDAIRAAFGEAGRYPDNPFVALTLALMKFHGVTDANIVLGSGSGEILRMAVCAFASPTRALVQGQPTFEDPSRYAEVIGAPVVAVPVDAQLRLDLDAMAGRAAGAGLVFLCNPNNPTATVHSSSSVSGFVAKILKASPDTTIIVDEAYHHYVEDPSYASAIPLALENPRVVVCRTFSKAYGMAGLRIGYAVGREDTIKAMRRQKLANNVNVLGAVAAISSLGQAGLIERERARNHDVKEMTQRAFDQMGFKASASEANFIMVDIRRDVRTFQAECRKLGVLVGRPFPPLNTHARISLGTADEMRQAIDVFKKVLAG